MHWESLMTEKHFITAIVGYLVLVVLKAYVHVDLFDRGIDPHVGKHKVLGYILNSMAVLIHWMAFPIMSEEDLPKVLVILLFQFTWHQAIFAPTQNKIRGLSYFYLGKNSGGFDKYFVERPTLYKVFYCVYCILAVISIWLLNIVFRP